MERSPNNTRRQFIAGSAGALGGLAVGSAFVSPTLAQQDGEDGEDDEEDSEFEDDVAILNYARTLEFLEADFYRQGLENMSEEELCNCDALREDSYLQEVAWSELQTILSHEESHAELLGSAVTELGGEPVTEPEFDFGVRVEYPMAFLATAAQLEDIGVAAYAGAAPSIEEVSLVGPALAIHSVEARHASFLHALNGETGFPDALDESLGQADVLDVAGEFIVDEDAPEDDDSAEEEPDAETPEGEDPVDEPADDGTAGNETDDGTAGNETDGGGPAGNETDDGTANETAN